MAALKLMRLLVPPLVAAATALMVVGVRRRKKNRRYSKEEWALRCELAAAYRLAWIMGWDEVIYNHITVRLPGPEPTLLINPFGLHFSEVTPESLVKIDLEGKVLDQGSTALTVNLAGLVIHSAVHEARDDLHCVLHTHHAPSVVVGMRELLPLSQEACIIAPKVSPKCHEFEGIATDPDEKTRLVDCLGAYECVFLRHHGVLCCGPTIAAAFWNTYILMRACHLQVEVMKATPSFNGRGPPLPKADIVQATADRLQVSMDAQGQSGNWGRLEFDALRRAHSLFF